MSSIEVKQIVQAPVEAVFKSWNDFGNIYKFHPGLKHSHLLKNSAQGGLGAERQCDMKDGKNWIRERVIDFEPNQRLVIDIYEGTMPIKQAKGIIEFKDLDSTKTEISFSIDFEPGLGLLGQMMKPVMKMQFRSMIRDMLKNNAEFVEKGKQANPTLVTV